MRIFQRKFHKHSKRIKSCFFVGIKGAEVGGWGLILTVLVIVLFFKILIDINKAVF